jgi:hypothetical protein
MASAQALDLPASVVIKTILCRLEPRACYGDWEPRLDAMMDRWLHSFLRPGRRLSRFALLVETGMGERLSTRVLRRAISLRARATIQPSRFQISAVLSIAAEHPSTWTSSLNALLESLDITDILDWPDAQPLSVVSSLPKTSKTELAAKYLREVVDPGLAAREASWWYQQAAHHVQLPPPTTIDLAHCQWPLSAARQWVAERASTSEL